MSLLAGLVGVTSQWRRAESQRAHAEAEALIARRNAYAADMKEVQRALEDSDLGRARELLDRHRPGVKAKSGNQKVEIDLRGWEWRYLWSRCQSDERFTLCRYSNAVSAVAFSADGKWLAVQLQGGPVLLWDAVAKQPRAELPFHSSQSSYKALAFSPLENLVAWANQDASGSPAVTFRDLDGRRELPACTHPTAIRSIAFSPDAQALATMDQFGTVRVWDLGSQHVATNFLSAKVESRNELTSAPLRPHSTAGWAQHYGKVLFSPDGRWLAAGEIQARIRLLDRRTGQERQPLRVLSPGDGITALAFSPDSKLLAAGCGVEDSDVHIWDLESGSEVRLIGHSGWIASLAFSPDGRTLASASADQTLCLWDVTRKTKRQRFQGNAEEIWALAWSPKAKDLVTGAKDGSVRFWDPEREPVQPYQVLPERVQIWTPAFLPDSETLLALTRPEGLVVRWDAATLQAVERLSALGSNHQTMDLSVDGRWLALGDADGNVRVCNLPEQRILTNFFLPACTIAAVVFSPRGNLLICGAVARDGSVTGKVWSVPGWREISLEGIDLNIADKALVSPDERILAVGYRDGTAAWWDLTTRERRAHFDCRYAGGVQVAFSPDERWFATGGFDGLLTVWDTATRQAKPFGRAHRNELQDLAFSPDGQRLVTSGTSPRGVVKLWDIETGRDLATLPGEFGWFLRVGFSPDGETVFAASSEGTALLWHGRLDAITLAHSGILESAAEPSGGRVQEAFESTWGSGCHTVPAEEVPDLLAGIEVMVCRQRPGIPMLVIARPTVAPTHDTVEENLSFSWPPFQILICAAHAIGKQLGGAAVQGGDVGQVRDARRQGAAIAPHVIHNHLFHGRPLPALGIPSSISNDGICSAMDVKHGERPARGRWSADGRVVRSALRIGPNAGYRCECRDLVRVLHAQVCAHGTACRVAISIHL